MADNLLKELKPRTFQLLSKLKLLDLSANPMDDLPPDVFRDIQVSDRKQFEEICILTKNMFAGIESPEVPTLPIEKYKSTSIQLHTTFGRIGFG